MLTTLADPASQRLLREIYQQNLPLSESFKSISEIFGNNLDFFPYFSERIANFVPIKDTILQKLKYYGTERR